MAGLTKAQRSEREAAQQPVEDGLIAMTKNGETTYVHPSCVKSHEAVGWSMKESN